MPDPKQKYRNRSLVWNSFRKIDDRSAQCLVCNVKLKFCGSTSNLRKHLRGQHGSASNKLPVTVKTSRYDSDEDLSALAGLAAATSDDYEPEMKHTIINSSAVNKTTMDSRTPVNRSLVWQYFTKSTPDHARCLHCSEEFSYRGGSTSNLHKHIRSKHRDVLISTKVEEAINTSGLLTEMTVELVADASEANGLPDNHLTDDMQVVCDVLMETIVETTAEDRDGNDEADAFDSSTTKKFSGVWRFFSQISKARVRCNLCNGNYSYCNSTSNLRKHLIKIHGQDFQSRQKRSLKDDGPMANDGANHTSSKMEDEDEEDEDDEEKLHDITVSADNEAAAETIASIYVNIDGQMDPLLSNDVKPAATATSAANVADVAPTGTAQIAGRVTLDVCLHRLLTDDLAATVPAANYVCPFLSTVNNTYLADKYQEVTQSISHALQRSDHVVLTVATWSATADPTAIYLAITAHFITRDDWLLHAVLLSCSHLADTAVSDPSNASISASIAQYMRHACAFWRITGKVYAVVSDGCPRDRAANAFGTATSLGWSRLQCLDQRLSECISAALQVNEWEVLRLKIDSIVHLIEQDDAAAVMFAHFQVQRNPGAEPHRLLRLSDNGSSRDGPTDDGDDGGTGDNQRWRRTLAQLQQLCALQEAIDATLELQRHDTRLSIADWMAVRDVRDLMQSFGAALEELRTSATVSTSKAIVLLHGLSAQLAAHRCSVYRTETSKELAQQLQENLRVHMADTECDLLLAVCTFLDPRFGRCGFVRKQAMRICQLHVETLASGVRRLGEERSDEERDDDEPSVNDYSANADAVTGPESMWNWLDVQVGEQRVSQVSPETLAQHEMHFYTGQLALRRRADPLQWWRRRGQVACPRLALVARKYLALPATCATSRRALAAAQRLSQACWGLDQQQLKMVLFLQENMNFYHQ